VYLAGSFVASGNGSSAILGTGLGVIYAPFELTRDNVPVVRVPR
jgi:hypothetical protein